MTKRLITIDDVKRTNSRMMGKTCMASLSPEDTVLYEKVRRTLIPIIDTSELRKIWKKAQDYVKTV